MAELATVKSAFPSVVTHSDALEFHSLFSTVYAPPATEATVGLLVRRTVPAIAFTLAVFTAVQVAVPLWVRPHIFTPARTVSALNQSAIIGMGSGWATGNKQLGRDRQREHPRRLGLLQSGHPPGRHLSRLAASGMRLGGMERLPRRALQAAS
jgi:hypothetical protein